MATFAQLVGRVKDTTHRPKNQDDAEIKALVNEAYFHIVAELSLFEKSATETLVAGVGDYDITVDFSLPDFAAVRSISYSPANGMASCCTLNPTTVDEIVALRSANPTATSPALAYAIRGWKDLLLQPLPGLGDQITITYAAFPLEMLAPTDTPSVLPPNWHHLIVSYAAATAMEVVSVARAQQLMESFEMGELKRARKWFNNQYGSKPLTPGMYRRSVRWPSDVW
jgi:hypothetical protein